MVAFLDDIGKALSYLKKPQGAIEGGKAGLMKMIFRDQVDPENKLGYKDPLRGLISGFKSGEGPSSTQDKLMGRYEPSDNFVANLLGGLNDAGQDPLNALGPLLGASKVATAIPTAGKIARGASTVGGLEKGAGIAPRVGQNARRFMTGMQFTNNPLEAAGTVPIQNILERLGVGAVRSGPAQRILAKAGATGGKLGYKEAVDTVTKKYTPKTVPDVAKEGISGPTPVNPAKTPGATVTAQELGEDLGRSIRVEGGGPLAEGDEATAAGVAKLQALTGKSRPKAKMPKAPLEPLIGEAPVPNRGPLIGAPEEPDLTTQLQASLARAPGMGAPAPNPNMMPQAPQAPITPPQPMAAQQSMMQVPQQPTAMGGPIQTTAPGAMPQAPMENPAIPPFLQGKQPQLGMPPANMDVANLQGSPAIMQVMNDPTLTEDKKLEMILRGLGAIV